MEKATAIKSRLKKRSPTMQIGERVNPDNLRYIDNQGMVSDEANGGYWSSEFKAFMQAQTLKSLFYSEDWVFICVDSIALPISNCPIVVAQIEKTDDGKNRNTTLPEHPISKMFKNPNPYQSGSELSYSYAVDFILGGNGFLYNTKQINQIFNMPFERVAYDFDNTGLPTSVFFYNQQQDDVILPTNVYKTIPLEDVIHARKPNPSSAFWGLSPFTPGRKSVLTNRYTQDYILSFYLKGATPQMILEMENNASQKSLVRMIRSFEAAYTGRRNQRRTMVLPKGVKATVADTKIVDQQFIDLVKQNREVVLNILHVPKHALGLQESGSLGSREHDLALRWFWDQTIRPTINILENSLTTHFTKAGMLLPNQKIIYDTSEVKYTSDDLLQLSEVSNSLEKTWTLNERRERLFGLPPTEGGDKVVGIPQPPALPFGLSAQQPEAMLAPEPEQLTTSLVEEPVAEQPVPEQPRGIRAKYGDHLKRADETIKSELEKKENKMLVLATKLLADETEVFIDSLNSSVREQLDKKEWEKNVKKGLKKLEKEYLKDYTETLESTVEAGYDAQVQMVFDNKSQDALAAYKETDVKGSRLILKERGLLQFKSVNKTSTENVMRVIEQGLADGLSVDKISGSIVKYMKENARWRANMIARTETLTAFSVGSNATIKRASEVIPEMQKMWVTSMDERVRDDHQTMEGRTIAADEDFVLPDGSKAYGPRSPGLSAAQSIACRCIVLMLPPEDVNEYAKQIEDMPKDYEE